MKSRIFSILAVALILVTSFAMVGCGGGGATFAASGLTLSANPVEVGTAMTISATITNSGGASGTCNVTLNIGGANVETKSVEVAASSSQIVTFTYTPSAEGNFNVSITPGYLAKGTLGVVQTPKGYWDVQYAVANGSRITLNYSLEGIGGIIKVTDLHTGDGTVTIRVNKTANVNGSRDITLLSAGWQLKAFTVKAISYSIDMNLTVALGTDAKGVLYVQGGVGDVDMNSTSSRTTKPKEIDTVATGKKAPAGSMLVATALTGYAHLSIGKDVILPFGLTFTTGNTTNIVSIPSTKFNGATISSQGTPFAKSGTLTVGGQKLPDYVGTAGTITTTGTGDCLGITLVNFKIDFQAEIKLVLEPVSVTSGQ